MVFYLRSESVPELEGLSRWERRVMLRGTFLRERTISTMVLLVVLLTSVNFVLNPLLQQFAPQIRSESLNYGLLLFAWLLLMMGIRDVIMMNLLRPKIAAKRAEIAAKQAAEQTTEPV